jgi:hypothetical protein
MTDQKGPKTMRDEPEKIGGGACQSANPPKIYLAATTLQNISPARQRKSINKYTEQPDFEINVLIKQAGAPRGKASFRTTRAGLDQLVRLIRGVAA